MTPTGADESPDSLELILTKAKAINNVNADSIAFIDSRKDQQVIVDRKYSFQSKEKNDDENTQIILRSQNIKRKINNIIKSWRYSGQPLQKEVIVLDKFINTTLSTFQDLCRLQHTYDYFIQNYQQVLSDTTKSRQAATIILRNVETLQIAIGDIHQETIDVIDILEGNDDIGLNLRNNFKLERVPSITKYEKTTNESLQDIVPSFEECSKLYNSCYMRAHESAVMSFETYMENGEYYLISGSEDNTIKIWDIEDNSNIATLSGHTETVYSLALFRQRNVLMLASGSSDNRINIWDLCTKELVRTLETRQVVNSLVTYEKDGMAYLASSGNRDRSVDLWNLTNHSLIDTIRCKIGFIQKIAKYCRNSKPYLVVAADNGLSIWCLSTRKEVTKLEKGNFRYTTISVVEEAPDLVVVAGGTDYGHIRLWKLKKKHTFLGSFCLFNQGYPVESLHWIICEGKLHLAGFRKGDHYLKICDFETQSLKKSLDLGSQINSLQIIKKDGYSCFITGHQQGHVSFWEE